MSEELQVIEPEGGLKFVAGVTQTVVYQLKNNADFPIRDITIQAVTIKKDGAPTSINFASILSVPKVVYPGEAEILQVKISVPYPYTEKIMKDNKLVTTPFNVKVNAHGIEHIGE